MICTQEYQKFFKGLYVCFKNLQNGKHLGKSLFPCHAVEALHHPPCRRRDLHNLAPVSALQYVRLLNLPEQWLVIEAISVA